MFGYVMPHKCELLVRENMVYEGWYCGLCKTLKERYSQSARTVLDYDCTFLALLLSAVTGENASYEDKSCALKPLKAKRPMPQSTLSLEYAADMNVLLAFHKCADDWHDEKKFSALAAKGILHASAKKAQKYCPKEAQAIEAGINELSAYERTGGCEIDEAAHPFASILQTVFAGFPALSAEQKTVLGWLGYHLGRWIYLMDAWEDREKDAKTGSYNPFLRANATKERASFLLYASLSEIEKAYDLLEIKLHKGILDNIVHMGCRLKVQRLMEAKERTQE